MKRKGRIDPHCHLFNIFYALKEALNMAWEFLCGTYPSGKGPGETQPRGSREAILKVLSDFLDWFLSLYSTVFYSECRHYRDLKRASRSPQGWNYEVSLVYPLMMDVFYIFAGPETAPEWAAADSGKVKPGEEEAAFRFITAGLQEHIRSSKEYLEPGYFTDRRLNNLAGDFLRWQSRVRSGKKSGFHDTWGFHDHRKALERLKRCHKNRVFNFFAVDPRREGAVEKAIACTLPGGLFTGIKLYTYLGYKPDLPGLEPLYAHCVTNAVPITVHCNIDGFPREEDWPGGWPYKDWPAPALWSDILERHSGLWLNFAHFGIDAACSRPGWTETIVEYMQEYDHVYADLACFSTDQMLDNAKEHWTANPVVRERLMFGTDYVVMPLAHGMVGLKQYFRRFGDKFSEEELNRLAVVNPKKFLQLA